MIFGKGNAFSLVILYLSVLLMARLYGQSTWRVFNKANSGLPSDTVNCIAFQADGQMFIGTNAGITIFDGKDWTVFNRSNCPLPGDTIQEIYIDRRGCRFNTPLGRKHLGSC